MKRSAAGKEVAALQGLLERFEKHSRRPLLEHVLPAEMLKGRARKAFSGLTIAEIASEGGFRLAARPAVQASDLRALIEILTRLFEGDHSKQSLLMSAEFENVDGGFAQIELSRALDSLSSSGALERIGNKTLKEYWDKDWPRAPFEEVLTFKQLAGLDLSSLLKKRAFTPDKMLAVSKVIDRAIAVSAKIVLPKIAPGNTEGEIFRGNHFELLRFQSSNLNSFLAACTRAAFEHAAYVAPHIGMGALLKALLASERSDAVIAALVLASMPQLAAGALLELAPNELSALGDRGRAEISRIAASSAATLVAQLEAALLAPAVSEAMLLSTVACEEVAAGLQLALVRVLLGAGSAKQPLIFGERLGGFWTKNERSAEMLLRGVMAGLPKSESELTKELTDLIAGVEPQVLIAAILRGGARRDKKGLISQ